MVTVISILRHSWSFAYSLILSPPLPESPALNQKVRRRKILKKKSNNSLLHNRWHHPNLKRIARVQSRGTLMALQQPSSRSCLKHRLWTTCLLNWLEVVLRWEIRKKTRSKQTRHQHPRPKNQITIRFRWWVGLFQAKRKMSKMKSKRMMSVSMRKGQKSKMMPIAMIRMKMKCKG